MGIDNNSITTSSNNNIINNHGNNILSPYNRCKLAYHRYEHIVSLFDRGFATLMTPLVAYPMTHYSISGGDTYDQKSYAITHQSISSGDTYDQN